MGDLKVVLNHLPGEGVQQSLLKIIEGTIVTVTDKAKNKSVQVQCPLCGHDWTIDSSIAVEHFSNCFLLKCLSLCN